jgi:type IV pilus assembly protein PilE
MFKTVLPVFSFLIELVVYQKKEIVAPPEKRCHQRVQVKNKNGFVRVQQPHIRDSREGEKRSLLMVNEHFRPTDYKVNVTTERLHGFTLIELLVVIAILGILVATAFQTLIESRKKAFDTDALQTLKTVAAAEEAYFADNEIYKSCNQTNCSPLLPGVASINNSIVLTITSSTGQFTGTASHSKGTGITFSWDSSNGGLQ